MRRSLVIALLMVVSAVSAWAQTTAVSGTITDSNGNPYANGTVSAQAQLSTGAAPPAGLILTTTPTALSAAGAFTITLSSGFSYTFTICSAPTLFGVPGTNPTPKQICFSNTTPIAISGATQDVSAALNAVASLIGPANLGMATGITPVVHGGTGTATPTPVAGANIAITGAWPNQTTAFSGTLPQTSGGTGATSLAGANIPVQTGTITTGDCVKWASATNVTDLGSPCAGTTLANAFTSNVDTKYLAGTRIICNKAGTSSGWAGADVSVWIANAEADLGTGGGILDARSCVGSQTISQEIDVGSSTSTPVTLLLPATGTWTSTQTGGTAYALRVFNGSSVIGTGTGEGQPFSITTAATANVDSVCGNDPSNGGFVRMEGFACNAGGSSVVGKAILHINGAADESYVGHMAITDRSVNPPKALWIHNSCCSAKFEEINAETSGLPAGAAVPCTFGNGGVDYNTNIHVEDIGCVHPPPGKNAVVIQQNGGGNGNVFQGIYMEQQSTQDLTTPYVSIQPFGGGVQTADTILGMTTGVDVTGSARYSVDIAAGSRVTIIGLHASNTSPNIINDHNTGAIPLTGIAGQGTEVNYSTEPFFAKSIIASGTLQASGFVGSFKVSAIGTPAAPTITQGGTAGTTSYTYFCVAQDSLGNQTVPSAAGTTTTGNATLSATNFNIVSCGAQGGAVSYNVLKTNTATKLGSCSTASGAVCILNDTGQATAAFAAQTTDQTGQSVAATMGPSTSQQHTIPAVSPDTFILSAANQQITNKINLIANGAPAAANGNVALSAGWGTTASVSGAAGFPQHARYTITSAGTGQAANPTITVTLPWALPAATTICTMMQVGGTQAFAMINQTTNSATAPVFTYAGTPVAANTVTVDMVCGP